jgi:hypothetical protein
MCGLGGTTATTGSLYLVSGTLNTSCVLWNLRENVTLRIYPALGPRENYA